MSSNINSVPPFSGGTTRDAIEALGITQFPSAVDWYQVIGGIIVQGGRVDIPDGDTLVIAYNAPYEKQCLGVWIQTIGGAANGAVLTDPPGLNSFEIVNGVGDRGYFWLSLGV